MNWKMTRALLWKEWRETRWKFLAFFLVFHAVAWIFMVALLVDEENRFALRTAPADIVYHGFEGAIFVQSIFTITVGLFLILFYAASTVSSEIASRRIFFILERPVKRRQVLRAKFAVSGLQVYALMALTPLTMLLAAYVGVLIFSRTVPFGQSLGQVVALTDDALAMGLYRGVVGVMVFSLVFSLSVAFEHWWISLGAGVASIIAMFYFFGKELVASIFEPAGNLRGEEFSLQKFGEISSETFLVVLLVAMGFFILSQILFQRKQIA